MKKYLECFDEKLVKCQEIFLIMEALLCFQCVMWWNDWGRKEVQKGKGEVLQGRHNEIRIYLFFYCNQVCND